MHGAPGLESSTSAVTSDRRPAPAPARYAVRRAPRKGRAAAIPGASNDAPATLMRAFPKALVVPVVERLYRAGVNK